MVTAHDEGGEHAAPDGVLLALVGIPVAAALLVGTIVAQVPFQPSFTRAVPRWYGRDRSRSVHAS